MAPASGAGLICPAWTRGQGSLADRHPRRGPVVPARAGRQHPGTAHSARPANGQNPSPDRRAIPPPDPVLAQPAM